MITSLLRADESQVLYVPEPEWTDTWHPISHAKVVGAVGLAVQDAGFEVVDKTYTLTGKDYFNMFASWRLNIEEEGISYAVGMRNSMSKQFAVGMCSGTHIVVCSNMNFSGKYVEFRKHTGGLDYEQLVEMAKRAFGKVLKQIEQMKDWLKELRERPINNIDIKLLTYDAMKSKLLLPTKFNDFVECLESEENVETSGTLFHFYNAFTRLIRDESLFAISHRSAKFTEFVDKWVVDHPVLRRRQCGHLV